MKEIHDYLLENMPVPVQRECLHEVYEATNSCEFVKTNMQRVWDSFSAAYLYMERIYQIPIGSNLITEDIVTLDSIRDRAVNAIDSMVEGQTKSPNDDVAAAARQLAQTKVSFPVDTQKGYLYQTGQLDSYLAVMLGEQLENTTKVGVLSLVQTLKSINDQIHTLIAERGDENVDKSQDLSRPAARGNAVNAWRSLIKYVNGYNIVVLGPTGANEQLDRYIDTCNEISDRYRSIYLGGAGNRPVGSEDEEEDVDSDTDTDTDTDTEGEQEQETTPTKYTATFVANGATVATQEYEAGEVINAPAAPSGYEWEDFPYRMPANDITVNAVRKNIPGGGGGSGFE